MTISFQKYDSTSEEIETSKVRTSEENGKQSNGLQLTTDLQMTANQKGKSTENSTGFSYFSE